MATRRWIAALVALALLAPAPWFAPREAQAQPDLPPPPPPPMGGTADAPEPASPTSSPRPPPARRSASPSPRRPREPRALSLTVVPAAEPPAAPAEVSRPMAITLNPLGLPWGRLSANVEVLVARHHAVVLSPNVLVAPADRGGAHAWVSEGLGFASRASNGVGLELGYHYWLFEPRWVDGRSARGPFVGPSILLGGTTQANVGDPSHLQGYWGLAIDAGYQEVLASGLTFGGGVGVGLLRMADFSGAFPRVLLQVGWSL